MPQRNFVTFDWPSEDPEDREVDGEVVPGGCAIMEAVQQAVRASGYLVDSVEQHDSYGWCFEAKSGDDTVWSMLQYSEPWLLISEVRHPFLRRLFGRTSDAALVGICKAIHQALVDSASAGNVQWFSRDEFQAQKGENGASSP